MRAYITKYALTKGIQIVYDAEGSISAPDMIRAPSLGPFATFHVEGKEWHRTEAQAVERAKAMQARKVASLSKELARVLALEFNANTQ